MRDPHVERLHYTVGSGSPTIAYSNPPPMSFTNDLGVFELRDGKAVITPSEHFATEDEARTAIEPFLKSWEVAIDLTQNLGAIRFTVDRSEVIDRDPPPPGSPIELTATVAGLALVADAATVLLIARGYPDPPESFQATSDVQLAYRRWLAYRAGSEPLPGMAYFVLDLLNARAGTRKKAAEVFGISRNVLSRVGRLSNRGDALTARHVKRGLVFKELTGAESSWLEHAVRRLLLRMGEHAAGVALTKITMADLPSL